VVVVAMMMMAPPWPDATCRPAALYLVGQRQRGQQRVTSSGWIYGRRWFGVEGRRVETKNR